MGTIFVISSVLPSSTYILISVVLLFVFSFTSFNEVKRIKISLVMLGSNYSEEGYILKQSLYSFFFVAKESLTG